MTDSASLIKVIAVVGPTASGKSALGMEIAKALGGEIISADSMAIYKGMDIGTAKPTKEERAALRHHCIDLAAVTDAFSVADYCAAAHRAAADCAKRGVIPILVGGTGLYVDNFLNNTDFCAPEGDEKMRASLLEYAHAMGAEALYAMLQKEDAYAAAKLHPNDVKRVIRALESVRLSGKTRDVRDEQSKGRQIYESLKLSLDIEREVLYNRINKRVDAMFASGLVDEVKKVILPVRDRCTTALGGIGYKEVLSFLDGEATLGETIETVKMQTRRYAKRQETWFRRDENIIRVQSASALELAHSFINGQ